MHGARPRCRHVTQLMFPGHDQPCQTRPERSRRDADSGQPVPPPARPCRERTRRLHAGRQLQHGVPVPPLDTGKNPGMGPMGRQQPVQLGLVRWPARGDPYQQCDAE